MLTWWEVRLDRQGGEPVVQVGLMHHRSFWAGQCLALLYFDGFTSLFFTLSILWQEGLGRSALETGLLVLPFALASLTTASNSYKFSDRIGRRPTSRSSSPPCASPSDYPGRWNAAPRRPEGAARYSPRRYPASRSRGSTCPA